MSETVINQPQWVLVYAGKNITERISPYVLSAAYTDHLTGQADELEITVEDRDGRWKAAWLPEKGDAITLQLGYAGSALMDTGSFQVDELDYSGPPDIITIRALAAGVKQSLRTRRSTAFEGVSLKKIATDIAARNGLTIRGVVPDITIGRSTQNHETDLGYLKRLADMYGVVFSVKGSDLVWHDLDRLDGGASVITIERQHLPGRYALKSRSSQVYRACVVSYFDSKKKRVVTHQFTTKGIGTGTGDGDILKLVQRAENKAQAQRMAAAALRRANGRQVEGSLDVAGNIVLRAGRNITLSGWGSYDGQYQITSATHRIDRGQGYTTGIEFALNGVTAKKGSK